MIETEIYFLIGQSTVYVINCIVSVYLLYRFNKNIISEIDKIKRQTEPIQEPEPQQDTARVDRESAIQMNCYYDKHNGNYEITPKESN